MLKSDLLSRIDVLQLAWSVSNSKKNFEVVDLATFDEALDVLTKTCEELKRLRDYLASDPKSLG